MNKRASCVETPLGTLLCTSMLGSCKLIDVQSFNLIANAAASRWVSRRCDRLEYSACGIHDREAAHFSLITLLDVLSPRPASAAGLHAVHHAKVI